MALLVKIGADLKDLDKQINRATREVQYLGRKLEDTGKSLTKNLTAPILGAGAAVLAFGVKLGNTADEILDLQAATGHSTQAIQEWRAVADRAGVSTDAVTNASQALTRAMARGAEGSADMRMALEELGLSMEEVENASPDERMQMIIAALQGVEDESQRAILGNKLLRGSYEDLAPILAMTEDEMAGVVEQAHESGRVMSDEALESADNFRKGLDELKGELMGMAHTIGGDLMPVLSEEFIPYIQDNVVPALRDFGERVGQLITWFNELDPVWQKTIGLAILFLVALGPVLIVVGKAIVLFAKLKAGLLLLKPVALAIGAVIGGLSLPMLAAIAGVAALIAIGVALWKNWDTVKEKAAEFGEKIKGIFEGVKENVVGAFNSMKDSLKNIMNSLIRILNKLIDGINAIGFDVPSWVPVIGGKSFGFDVPKIPMLAKGGLAYGPTLAMIGEGRDREAVLPLNRNIFAEIAAGINQQIGNAGGRDGTDAPGRQTTINATLNVRTPAEALRELNILEKQLSAAY